MSYFSIGKFKPQEVLPFVIFNDTITKLMKKGLRRGDPEWKKACEREFAGHMVNMASMRYRLFATKGVKCVKCGIEGTFFSLEKCHGQQSEKYHFNLYGINSSGKPVMMTKDHIMPKSKGGANTLKNLQPMCIRCNGKKADTNEPGGTAKK